jgi:hypothetical protein
MPSDPLIRRDIHKGIEEPSPTGVQIASLQAFAPPYPAFQFSALMNMSVLRFEIRKSGFIGKHPFG